MDSSTSTGRSTRIDLAAIVSHPLRGKALEVLSRRTASPTEIARELNEPDVSKVAYHVGKLLEIDAIELVGEKKVRGAVEHFYRARVLPAVHEEDWARLTMEQRREFSIYTVQRGLASISSALEAGTFDQRTDRCITRIPAILDETGWSELADLHLELYERTMRIREDAANRIALDTSAPTIKTTQFAMFFEEP